MSIVMTDASSLAHDERSDLLNLLETLSDAQWRAPSLCRPWTVHQVVAHVVSYEELDRAHLAVTLVRSGLMLSRANARQLARYERRTPSELMELLRRHLRPRGLTAGFGGAIGLTDALIHHQDIRRAIELPRAIPPERLRVGLDLAVWAPVLPGRRLLRGLGLTATDLPWSRGTGSRVTGEAEPLLMAIAGRREALADLRGCGVAVLEQRIGNG